MKTGGRIEDIPAKAVVLAAGGFQGNYEWRTRYLGPGWELAKVRGTRFNTGDGIRMALDIGAMPYGNWSGCHAVGWERNAPEFGDLAVGDQFQKHSYPFAIMVNATGRRFVDEGRGFPQLHLRQVRQGDPRAAGAVRLADLRRQGPSSETRRVQHPPDHQGDREHAGRARTAARRGRPGCLPRRGRRPTTRPSAPTFPSTPTSRTGDCTEGLAVPKSNWANRIDEPPFEAYAVTCGITFTFGGLRIDTDGQVLDTESEADPGPVRGGRAGRRHLLFQLPGRQRADLGLGIRPHRRRVGIDGVRVRFGWRPSARLTGRAPFDTALRAYSG